MQHRATKESMYNRKNWLKLPIQFFSEDPPKADPPKVDDPPKALTLEEVQKLIQSETDKVRTEYSKKNLDLQKLLDDEKKSKLSVEEQAALRQKELEDKELELQQKENKIFAIGALSEAEMPSTFLDFVTSDKDESTTERIKVLKEEFDKAVAAKVEETFKGSGRKFQKGNEFINPGTTNFADLAAKNNIRNK